MFRSPFAYVMVATFLGALVTLLMGIASLGSPPTHSVGDATTPPNSPRPAGQHRATRLMALRVGLCALLLFEIIIYITWLRPAVTP